MNEWQAHFAAALEAIQASNALVGAGSIVPAAFFACHAFEMAGGAYVVFIGEDPSEAHGARCRQFASVANRGQGFGHGVSAVAAEVVALRNRCLYAREAPGFGWQPPSGVVDEAKAREIVRRVEGIIEIVDRELPE